MNKIIITHPISGRGKPRRKIMFKRNGIYIGSIWVHESQDLTERINTLMARVGATLRVPPRCRISTLPAYLL